MPQVNSESSVKPQQCSINLREVLEDNLQSTRRWLVILLMMEAMNKERQEDRDDVLLFPTAQCWTFSLQCTLTYPAEDSKSACSNSNAPKGPAGNVTQARQSAVYLLLLLPDGQTACILPLPPVMLGPKTQISQFFIHIFNTYFFIVFSIIVNHRISNIVPWAIQ